MPGDTALVSFQNWIVPSTDSSIYLFTVCTEFMEDADTTNDCAQKSIFAYTPVGIEEIISQLPNVFALYQNFPNPFHKLTVISYQIPDSYPESRIQHHVSLNLYDLTGSLVSTLVNEYQAPGVYQVEWDSRIPKSGVRSGIYFYRLHVDDYTATKKLILIR
jgi:hypothetical protein